MAGMRRLLALPLLLAPTVAAPARADTSVPVERRLHLGQVEASSFLWNDWNKFQENYHPLYVADDDPATAWVEGAKGPGAGEWVRLRVTPMAGATKVRLRVRNGYQKSPALFRANARAKEVTITLLPSKAQARVTLADKDGWQDMDVAQPAGALQAVELKVESVYPGTKYEDLCISDAQVLVTATTPDNPAFERAKLDTVKKWKKERVDAAALFKTATAARMPVAAQYRVVREREARGEWPSECGGADLLACTARKALSHAKAEAGPRSAAIVLADKALASGFAGFEPVQVAPKDRRPVPAVDGLCRPSLGSCFESCYQQVEVPMIPAAAMFSTDQIGVFDAKDVPRIGDVLAMKLAQCKREAKPGQHAWALREKAGGRDVVRAILLASCGAVEEREGLEPHSTMQLLVYGEGGRLEVVTGGGYAALYDWKDGVLAGATRVGATGDLLRVEPALLAAK